MDLPEVACPSCGATYRHPGKSGSAKCKKCGAVVKFTVPEGSAPAAAAPAAAPARPAARPAAPAVARAVPAKPGAPAARPSKPGVAPPARVAGAKPSAAKAPARPSAARGAARPSPDAEGGAPAPIKPQGMNPAVLWGSVIGTIAVVIGVVFVMKGQSEDRARIAAEKKAAEEAAKAPAPKPATPAASADDGPTLSGKSAPADDGPSLSKKPGDDAPKAPDAAKAGEAATDKPADKPADPDASPAGPKRTFVPKELAVVENVPNLSEAESTKITSLLNTWLDPNETTGANKAMRELEQIGKPAIPFVLNRMRDLDLGDESKLREATALNRALQNITGKMYEMSRNMDEAAVVERQKTRQFWFSWWEKNKKTFAGKAAPTDE